MHVKPLPVQRGRPVCFTLDSDAERLLRAMAPHSKGLGMLVGELIRKDARERGDRQMMLRALATEGRSD